MYMLGKFYIGEKVTVKAGMRTDTGYIKGTVIGGGVYPDNGRRWVDVRFDGKGGSYRSRYFEEDLK